MAVGKEKRGKRKTFSSCSNAFFVTSLRKK